MDETSELNPCGRTCGAATRGCPPRRAPKKPGPPSRVISWGVALNPTGQVPHEAARGTGGGGSPRSASAALPGERGGDRTERASCVGLESLCAHMTRVAVDDRRGWDADRHNSSRRFFPPPGHEGNCLSIFVIAPLGPAGEARPNQNDELKPPRNACSFCPAQIPQQRFRSTGRGISLILVPEIPRPFPPPPRAKSPAPGRASGAGIEPFRENPHFRYPYHPGPTAPVGVSKSFIPPPAA